MRTPPPGTKMKPLDRDGKRAPRVKARDVAIRHQRDLKKQLRNGRKLNGR